MDSELDQVLCTVLSLEEDYPSMSPPPRFQDGIRRTSCTSAEGFLAAKETNLQDSIILQKLLEIYTLLEMKHETQGKSSAIPRERSCEPLKRKLDHDDDNDGRIQTQLKMEDFENDRLNKRRRKRTNYSMEQTTFLMNEYDCNPYPDFRRRCSIAKITGISEPRIQVWFQNRRARHLSKHIKFQNFQTKLIGESPQYFPEGETMGETTFPDLYMKLF